MAIYINIKTIKCPCPPRLSPYINMYVFPRDQRFPNFSTITLLGLSPRVSGLGRDLRTCISNEFQVMLQLPDSWRGATVREHALDRCAMTVALVSYDKPFDPFTLEHSRGRH